MVSNTSNGMNIIIKTTNIELSPFIREFIEKKIGSLTKFLKHATPGLIEARIEIGKPSRHHKSGAVFYAEANLVLPGKLLRAEANHMDLKYAINKIRDELEKQIEKYKNK